MTLNPNGKDCYAIIAGNGRFPFLVLEAAREQAIEPEVFAIQEEASVELAKVARAIHWLSLGEIAKLLDTLSAKGVNKVLLAGQGHGRHRRRDREGREAEQRSAAGGGQSEQAAPGYAF